MRTTICCWVAMAGFLHAGGLTFESELLDIQAAMDAKSVMADFKFQNKTDKPVTIAKVDKTCSCIAVQVADGKLNYAPGESGMVRATFELGNFTGVVDKSVTLFYDTDPADKPSQRLAVRIHIPELIIMSDKTLKWAIGSPPATRKIDISMVHTKPIKILTTTCTSEAFKLEVKALEEGKHYELLVTPLDTNQPALAIIRIETDCEVARHKLQQAFAVVRRELPANP